MKLDLSRIVLVTAAILCGGLPAAGQVRPVVISNEPLCAACQVRLEHLASLGDVDGAGALAGRPWSVTRTSAYFIVAAGFEPMELLVFDHSGTFVRTVGRSGEGPGEYKTVTALVPMPGDTLHVFDRALRRQTVLAPNFTVLRTARIGIPVHAAWYFDPARILVNGWYGGVEGTPTPLHLVELDGTVAASFGSLDRDEPPSFYALHPELFVRHVASSPNGEFWSSALNTYTIERRDRTGAVTQMIHRTPQWFVPWETQLPVTPDQPPATIVSGLRWSPDGKLIVLLDVPAGDWRMALGEPRQRPDGSRFYVWDPVQAYETIIEVLDPAGETLVMTERIDFRIGGFVDARTVYSYSEDEAGNPTIEVYELVREP